MIGLQDLIIKENIKVSELALEIGVTPGTVWDWFKKNRIPKNRLKQLSEKFNVDEEYLNKQVNDICIYKSKYELNKYEVKGDTTIIFVVRKNGVVLEVLIDTEDLQRFIDYNKSWHSAYNQHSKHYYILHGLPEGGRLYLHQWIMGVGTEVYVDHRNNNTLDNRKENLRITTNSDNLKNRKGKNKNNKSGYRNVCWDSRDNCWIVQLQVNGKNKVLGRFKDVDEAGKFAEEMRLKYYKEFAGKGD